jgi:signal transduction histidine kinase
MEDLKKYRLVFELFGSIIVFNKENTITFAGDLIKKELTASGIDIINIVSDNFHGKKGEVLRGAIERARKNQKSYKFSLKKGGKQLLVLPIKIGEGDVILSLKSEIDHVILMERDLRERVKELECLYNISQEIDMSNRIEEGFGMCCEHIKRGFQFPEFTSVIIEYNGKKFISAGGEEKNIKNQLSDRNISKKENSSGEIKVIYHRKVQFLKEEVNLLKEISRKFTKRIERDEKTKALEKQRKILIRKNKKLIELTEECRENREKLETMFRAFADKLIVIDRDFNITFSNSNEIGNEGKCYKKLFNNDNICKDCPAQKTFEDKEIASHDFEYTDQYFRLRTYPIFNDEGNIDRLLEVCRNITKEKKMENQLLESHKLASLGKLVAGVAHEINNPNTFILGNTKILQEAFTDMMPIVEKEYDRNNDLKIARLNYDLFKDNVGTLIDDINKGAVKIKKIVEELRSYAKKDEEDFADTIEINDIIENTVRLVKKQIKENVDIRLELGNNIPNFVGNISRLEQVIINLVLNASQAIGTNEGEIALKTDYDANNHNILFYIQDNGKGMDEVTRKNIFDPFFTTKRNEGGIGLGLSISLRIIKEHKGNIEVETKLGKGTKFTITLPVNDKN